MENESNDLMPSELINTTNMIETTFKEGSKIYRSNPFFRDLIGLMQNPEFHHFYNQYFSNWSDIETMVFYMKLYKAVEYGYQSKFSAPMEPELMTYTLHRIISTADIRRNAVKIFNNFKNHSINDQEIFCQLLDFQKLKTEHLQLKNT